VVAACSWNFPKMTMLSTFWDSARAIFPSAPREELELQSLEELAGLGRAAGLDEVEPAPLTVSAGYASFDELWSSFLHRVGPAGQYAASLDADSQDAVRDEFHRRLGEPEGSFELEAEAWAVRGLAPG
jgi:hypothetical protein